MTNTSHFRWAPERLPVSDHFLAELRSQWEFLAGPGTWWTGAERVAIAATARAARSGVPPAANLPLGDTAAEAATKVAASAHTLTAEHLDGYERSGLGRLEFVELVGVVVRVSAIDTALRGLGAPGEPLPVPRPGQPSRQTNPQAKRRSAWVPMAGGANPPVALTAVPPEAEAQERLHGVLYLTYDEMSDLDIHKGLHRTQLELVAARTSLLNECFF